MLRPMTVMLRRTACAVALAAVSAGCGTSGPASGSFASFAGVLGCAELVARGTVAATAPANQRLDVTFDVDEWVVPSSGSTRIDFLADDPAREVGTPPWPVSDERVLVVLSDNAPAALQRGRRSASSDAVPRCGSPATVCRRVRGCLGADARRLSAP